MKFGSMQLSVMRTVADDRWIDTSSIRPSGKRGGSPAYKACLTLLSKGLLKRDPKDSYRFAATETGLAVIREHDDPMNALRLENLPRADGRLNIVMKHTDIRS